MIWQFGALKSWVKPLTITLRLNNSLPHRTLFYMLWATLGLISYHWYCTFLLWTPVQAINKRFVAMILPFVPKANTTTHPPTRWSSLSLSCPLFLSLFLFLGDLIWKLNGNELIFKNSTHSLVLSVLCDHKTVLDVFRQEKKTTGNPESQARAESSVIQTNGYYYSSDKNSSAR